ncbi:hypothetical protein ACWGQ4_02350 [Streptomyces sp. NPDC055721]
MVVVHHGTNTLTLAESADNAPTFASGPLRKSPEAGRVFEERPCRVGIRRVPRATTRRQKRELFDDQSAFPTASLAEVAAA